MSPKILEVNCATGESVEREMTPQEAAAYQKFQEEQQKKLAEVTE